MSCEYSDYKAIWDIAKDLTSQEEMKLKIFLELEKLLAVSKEKFSSAENTRKEVFENLMKLMPLIKHR